MENWIYHLDALRHIVDFGLLVLIWLVQLTIYPGFAYMEHSSFKMWQEQYMNRMGFVAGGLILSQTTLVGLQVWLTPSSTIYLTAAIVILMWLITGFISVPLHHKLLVSGHDADVIRKLVQTNWLRTVGWSAIFFLGSGL